MLLDLEKGSAQSKGLVALASATRLQCMRALCNVADRTVKKHFALSESLNRAYTLPTNCCSTSAAVEPGSAPLVASDNAS